MSCPCYLAFLVKVREPGVTDLTAKVICDTCLKDHSDAPSGLRSIIPWVVIKNSYLEKSTNGASSMNKR